MNNLNKKVLIWVSIIVIIALAVFGLWSRQKEEEKLTIGISQIVEHPALDGARKGFVEALAEEGFVEGENIKIIRENAQGEMATARTIAQKFERDGVDMALAIATPCAQATANVLKETPVMITAVTAPDEAGLVKSLEEPGTNVTGTTDMQPIKKQLQMIKDFVPEVKTLGVLYNSGEANSVVQVDRVKKLAPELGLKIEEGTATNSSEVSLAASAIVDKVDAIYLPTDNVMASSVQSILTVTNPKKIPVFGAEPGEVENGALATLGISYFDLGKQTGKMAAKVLNGDDPATMSIQWPENVSLIINKPAFEKIGLSIPEEKLNNADKIIK